MLQMLRVKACANEYACECVSECTRQFQKLSLYSIVSINHVYMYFKIKGQDEKSIVKLDSEKIASLTPPRPQCL